MTLTGIKHTVFCTQFNQYDFKLQETTRVIIAGDINVPQLSVDASNSHPWDKFDFSAPRKNIDVLMKHGHFSDPGETRHANTWNPEPTWKNQKNNVGMRIDVILVPDKIKTEGFMTLHNITGSDHKPIVAILSSELSSHTAVKPGPMTLMNLAQRAETITADHLPMTATLMKLLIKQDSDSARPLEIDHSRLTTCKQEYHKGATRFANLSGTTTIHVEIGIGNRNKTVIYTQAMVDTGSTYCLMSLKMATEIYGKKICNRSTLTGPAPRLTLGDGKTEVQPMGLLRVPLIFKTDSGEIVKLKQHIYLIDLPLTEMILGHKFFLDQAANKVDISYITESILVHNTKIPWIIAPPATGSLKTLTTIALPARSSRVVEVTIEGDVTKNFGVITNCPGGQIMLPTKSFGFATNGLIKLYVTNFTDEDTCLNPGHQIGVWEEHKPEGFRYINTCADGKPLERDIRREMNKMTDTERMCETYHKDVAPKQLIEATASTGKRPATIEIPDYKYPNKFAKGTEPRKHTPLVLTTESNRFAEVLEDCSSLPTNRNVLENTSTNTTVETMQKFDSATNNSIDQELPLIENPISIEG